MQSSLPAFKFFYVYHLKVRHPRCVVKLTMCSMYVCICQNTTIFIGSILNIWCYIRYNRVKTCSCT